MALNTYTTKVALRVLVAFRFFAAGMFFEAVYMLPRKWKRQIRTKISQRLDQIFDRAIIKFGLILAGHLPLPPSYRLKP